MNPFAGFKIQQCLLFVSISKYCWESASPGRVFSFFTTDDPCRFGRMGVRFSDIPTSESADFARRAGGAIPLLHTRAQNLMVVEHLSHDFYTLWRYRLAKLNERRSARFCALS